ncbi:MAG TPA: type IX secretion system sortase PorU, partial [Bacteroidia bacterium]|nr:type IX secretion system sortase PorU [Bacteroidia bacterium]
VYGSGGGMLPFANSIPRNDDLVENAIYVSGESDGSFGSGDYVLFYGKGQLKWNYSSADSLFHHRDNYYSDTTYYFITADAGLGSRIQLQYSATQPATNFVNTFNDFKLHEVDLMNCVKSGKEWYGEGFDPVNTTKDINVSFPNIVTSNPVCMRSDVLARTVSTPPGSSFNFYINGFPVLTQTVSPVPDLYYGPCANESISNTCFNVASSDFTARMIFNPLSSSSQGWLNYLEFNAMRQLSMYNTQMEFRNAACTGAGNISEFTVSGVGPSNIVWDVTDPVNVRRQQGTFSGSNFVFRVPTDSLREFISFSGSFFLTPRPVGAVQNQNLHSVMSADLVIVTHPLFLTEAQRLGKHHHTHDAMTVAVVTPEQIYNEFSSGSQDVSAIRDFMRMLYNRNLNNVLLPKYLLLFGDGSYDNKYRIYNNTNFVITYQSDNSLNPTSTFISDNFFGYLDSTEGNWADGDISALVDIGIGRLPVKTVAEATSAVDKIINYATNGVNSTNPANCNSATTGFGEWRNIVTFIADDEDGGTHLVQAESLATKVDTTYPWYNIDKIYFDAYQQISTPGGERFPDAEQAFLQRVQRGNLLDTYIGHGGEIGLAHERVLTIEGINSWTNFNRLACFLTATCEFTRVDDPERNSAGELVFLNPEGGGIALFTTTRLAFSGSNFDLCKSFFKFVFEPYNNSMPSLGDIVRLTMNDYRNLNTKNFLLIGDPAMKLAYPRYNIATTEINNVVISATPDTLKALTRVTVSGEIRDDNGQLMTGFNGVLIPSVYDKTATYYTLGNNPGNSPIIPFKLRNKILFKGKATVANGKFTFKFIMPKDISYDYGIGRISYYAYNGVTDAKGYYDNIIIGGFGSDTTVVDDKRGPQIKLFMNDEKFVSGGITNDNPSVYAVISDESGINTTGNGIGHDMTVFVNDKSYKVNDFFETDLDSSNKGKLNFPLALLSEGRHTLRLKAWDIFNNSSETTIDFYVSASKEITLQHVYNYPNPFTTHTRFIFEHNRACVPMSVQVQIFTVTGKLIKTIDKHMVCDGFRNDDLVWDGRDDYGDKIGRGIYIYRLRIETADGFTADKLEKLVIL